MSGVGGGVASPTSALPDSTESSLYSDSREETDGEPQRSQRTQTLDDINAFSSFLRDVANELFRKGEVMLARSLYTSSLGFCRGDETFKSTLYLNRSACNLRASRFYSAYLDASEALELLGPEAAASNGKAWYRKATAAYSLGWRLQALHDAKRSYLANADPLVAQLIERIQNDLLTQVEFNWWKRLTQWVSMVGLLVISLVLFVIMDLGAPPLGVALVVVLAVVAVPSIVLILKLSRSNTEEFVKTSIADLNKQRTSSSSKQPENSGQKS